MIHAHAAREARAPLTPHTIETGPLRPFEVELAVTHCGICHSDIHLIDDDWHISRYPLVPGHEVVGTVQACGPAVTDVRVGQRVGVGWQSGSCLACEWCLRGDEMCCAQEEATCVGRPGGFADRLRVDSRFAHPLPDALASEHAAPLLCAGITVYAPLAAGVQPGMRVGVVGIGGLGHLALQFARAMGAEVTAFSTTPGKAAEAERFGAHHFVVSSDARQMEQAKGTLDYVLSTVTAPLDWPVWLDVLRQRDRRARRHAGDAGFRGPYRRAPAGRGRAAAGCERGAGEGPGEPGALPDRAGRLTARYPAPNGRAGAGSSGPGPQTERACRRMKAMRC